MHRMLYLHPERLRAVSIGAPGRSTYLDDTEDWYAGTRNFEEVFGQPIDAAALRAVPVLLIIGAQDTERIDYSQDTTFIPASRKNGSNRVERMRALYKNYQDYGLKVRFLAVPGVAHEGMKIIPQVVEFFKEIAKEVNV